VISRYIDNPYLIGGKKFDLRMYVLVTSYRPLKVWIYELGFGRFCTEKFSNDPKEITNKYMHLANASIAKTAGSYNDIHGSKWSINNLRFYMEQVHGKVGVDKCFEEINNIIYISLKSVQNVVSNDKHCFELYGYDILIDQNLKPWLIEVNASPSISPTTGPDRTIKMNLLQDVFKIVIPPDWATEGSKHGANMCKETTVGHFEVIIDEASPN
jgi:tubulin polyglutamylase TTLL1